MNRYILAVDQSTQGTKGLLFDAQGILVQRADRPHRQIISEEGWISHDPEEIRVNTLGVCRDVIERAGIDPGKIAAMGISNQRETTVAWNRETGHSICPAVVWQCSRAEQICESLRPHAEQIRRRTGLSLSPYFPAAKMRWILDHVPQASHLAAEHKLAFGTVDSWLLSFLTQDHCHKTDYSNASRTQLFDLSGLCWDPELCGLFGIPADTLPQVCMSDASFGMTDLDGYLPHPIPICGVLGDSHGALFGQACTGPGQIKATYGTGSSVMMNTGTAPVFSDHGLVTSLAWGMNGQVEYVLEGNLNYTGAVMTWLRETVGLIRTDSEATDCAFAANPKDHTYFVPAFSGLGAPYWKPHATGMLTGITRLTGKNEIARACLESIAYQITDLLEVMRADSGVPIDRLKVDGGPTASTYLMQFQADIASVDVQIPNLQELSGMGAAYAAGISAGLYDPRTVFDHIERTKYTAQMSRSRRTGLYDGWKAAVSQVLSGQP